MQTHAPFDKVYVVGAGAMGLHLAVQLSAIAKVILIARLRQPDETLATVQWSAATGGSQTKQFPYLSWDQVTDNQLLEDLRNLRTLIVHTTKCYDLVDSLKSIPKFCQAPILLFQNGIQVFDECQKQFPQFQFIRAACWFGALLEKRGPAQFGLHHTGGKKIELSKSKIDDTLSIFLNYAGFDPIFQNSVAAVEWRKAMLNIGLNGLCALTQTRNVEVLANPQLKEAFDTLVSEAFQVARAAGFTLGFSEAEALQMGHQGLQATGMNRNSTWIDIEKGSYTEIPWFNGKVVELAKTHGVKAPANTIISAVFEKLPIRSNG